MSDWEQKHTLIWTTYLKLMYLFLLQPTQKTCSSHYKSEQITVVSLIRKPYTLKSTADIQEGSSSLAWFSQTSWNCITELIYQAKKAMPAYVK